MLIETEVINPDQRIIIALSLQTFMANRGAVLLRGRQVHQFGRYSMYTGSLMLATPIYLLH